MTGGIGLPLWKQRRFLLALGCVALVIVSLWYWRFESAGAYFRQAQLHFALDPSAAEPLAEQAVIRAGGNYPAAQLLQCRALAAMGQWDAALGGLSLIQNTSRCDPTELLDLGRKAMDASEWKLAEISLLAAAIPPGSALSPALDLLVQLQLRFHRRDEALALCREWQRRVTDAAKPWAISGDLEAATVNFGAAIADYREALHRELPADLKTDVRSSLAQILVLAGDAVAARTEFELLMKSGSLTGKTQLIYVQLLRLEGRVDEGLAEIESYITRAGSNAESLKLRGILHLDAGHPDLALCDLKESVGFHPFDIAAQHKLAQAYIQSGDVESAKPHLERAQKMTAATLRIDELQKLLTAEPESTRHRRELKELNAVLGR